MQMISMAIVVVAAAISACGSPTAPAQSSGEFESAGARLAFTIEYPAGTGPFSAIVLVHGSGRVTRSDQQSLADRFVSHGYAVLNYDKRGTGASGGTYSGVGVANSDSVLSLLAADAQAALRTLRGAPNINTSRIGWAGGSQAGWIITLAAARDTAGRFAVVLSGPTVSVGREIYYSNFFEGTSTPLDSVASRMAMFSGPSGFDPLPSLAQIKIPVLWLFGQQDRSIPERESVTILRNLPQTGSGRFRIIEYPTFGHALDDSVWPDIYGWLEGLGSAR